MWLLVVFAFHDPNHRRCCFPAYEWIETKRPWNDEPYFNSFWIVFAPFVLVKKIKLSIIFATEIFSAFLLNARKSIYIYIVSHNQIMTSLLATYAENKHDWKLLTDVRPSLNEKVTHVCARFCGARTITAIYFLLWIFVIVKPLMLGVWIVCTSHGGADAFNKAFILYHIYCYLLWFFIAFCQILCAHHPASIISMLQFCYYVSGFICW